MCLCFPARQQQCIIKINTRETVVVPVCSAPWRRPFRISNSPLPGFHCSRAIALKRAENKTEVTSTSTWPVSYGLFLSAHSSFLHVETIFAWAGEMNDIPWKFTPGKLLFPSLGGSSCAKHLRPQNFQSSMLEELLRCQWCRCFHSDEVLLILVHLHHSL